VAESRIQKGEIMLFTLKGKTALVTGGSRGIGRAIGEKLAAEGARVVINYARNQRPARKVVSAVMAQGGEAVAIQADFSKAAVWCERSRNDSVTRNHRMTKKGRL
jgi:NAD(P)-dependent dehydrogenase (short-subunit alcohol dehydrogenase family)